MDNLKQYTIKINGVNESIDAVDALNKQLEQLEKRIKALESSSVKVGTSSTSTSSGGGRKSATVKTNDVSLQKELNNLEKESAKLNAKILATETDIYAKVQQKKELYKETLEDQKQMAAQSRLELNEYTNTMAGMKQHLADLKTVINTTDLGDSDQIKEMTREANELTNKLKEMEEAYGQFGRNVGNYANGVAEGLSKVKINVGGIDREFNNVREASRTLNNELKAMAVNGQTGTKSFKELQQTVLELESTMNDAKKPMDGIMDTMQSITAIASIGQGFRAFFGIDNAEIEKSLKRLMGLQTALKGISEINDQIKTKQGIGAWIAPFNSSIDKATAKLLTFNTALLGTGKASKIAAVGVKTFSKALKAAFSVGVLIAIDLLVEGLMRIVENFKKVDEAAEREKEVQKDLANAYGEAKGKLIQYKTTVDNFNGSKKEEKKLVEELNREFGSTLGTYKSLSQWQDVLKKKGDAYIQTLVNQAKAQAALNEVTAAYMNLEKVKQDNEAGKNGGWLTTEAQKREKDAYGIEQANKRIEKAEENLAKIIKENEEYAKKNGLGNFAPQIEKNTKKTENAIEKEQDTLNQLELRLMREGLNKKLRQLDEEERQTINKLKENGRKSEAAIQEVQRAYAQLRQKEINEYLAKLEESIKQSAKNIASIQFEINIKGVENQINSLKNEFDKLSMDKPIINTITSNSEIKTIAKERNVTTERMTYAETYNNLFSESEATEKGDAYYKFLLNYIKDKNKELYQDIADYNKAIYNETNEEQKNVYKKGLENTFKKVEDIFEEEYANELLIVRNYTSDIDKTLSESIEQRLKAQDVYNDTVRQKLIDNIRQQAQLNDESIKSQISAATEAERERYSIQMSGLTANRKLAEDGMKAIEESYKVSGLEGVEAIRYSNKEVYAQYHDLFAKTVEIDAQIEDAKKAHKNKLEEITKEGNNKLKENEINAAKEMSSEQEKYFDSQISNLRDAQSKINELLSKQPKTNALGIVNIGGTLKQYKELEDATTETINRIMVEKLKLEVLWKRGLITPEAKNAIIQQLNDLEAEIKRLLGTVTDEAKQTIPKFVQSCQVYLNGAFDAFNTIMGAVWDAQSTAFDKEQEQLDKELDAIQEKLNEYEQIAEEHKNNIDSIEDELATSRGDRRQYLIDQLNNEVEAQRRAEAEKQRLQREEEANKKKQDKLDEKRKKAQWQQQKIQALVNGAMSVTFASMNTWPIPAIPLMAMAAAAAATQYAIIASNKPYAKGGQLDGGVAVGNRHRDGGIKVLGGRAEIEGGEFITNRISTQMNAPLLEFINSKKKKIDASDLLEFYSSGSVKRNIAKVKTKFEDGGYVPTLPNSIDVRDQLQNIIINQDNRPIYVSVVDINNKQEQVRQVQALAGLSD